MLRRFLRLLLRRFRLLIRSNNSLGIGFTFNRFLRFLFLIFFFFIFKIFRVHKLITGLFRLKESNNMNDSITFDNKFSTVKKT